MTPRILFVVILLFSLSAKANTLSEDEKIIGRCVGVLAYSTNLALLQNNIGAAKLFMAQAARVNVAMILSLQEGSSLPKWKLTEIDKHTGDLGIYYNNNPDRLLSETDVCLNRTTSILTLDVYQTRKIDNKTIQEAINSILSELSKQLGI